eukprot:scaffold1774_cov193-Skeletonema_marinoi.AAC.2
MTNHITAASFSIHYPSSPAVCIHDLTQHTQHAEDILMTCLRDLPHKNTINHYYISTTCAHTNNSSNQQRDVSFLFHCSCHCAGSHFYHTIGVGAAVVEKSLRGRNADTVASANKHQHRVLQEEEEFTFLIADIQYEDGFTATSRKLQGNSGNKNPNRPERTMNVQDAEGMIYEIEAGSGDTAGTSSGSTVTLPDNAFMTPGTNKINLNGGGLKKKTKKEKKEKRDLQEDDSSTELRRHLTAIGTKTVVAVRVIASGGAYNWTDEAGLSDDVFGTNGDAYNLKTGFEGCSHNQLMINPGGEGRSDINNGVTTINVDVNATSGNHGNMANAVTAAIKAKFGVNDPTEIADQ